MSIFSIILTGVGLAMDAFAVSLAKGMCFSKKDATKYALVFAVVFGFFQAAMPFIGYFCSAELATYIQDFDHWVAFILLLIIGLKMVKEAFEEKDVDCDISLTMKDIIVLGIATSIDALAVGVSFAFLNVNILSACITIGAVTFVLSFLAVHMGKRLGNAFQKYAELFGGSILIILGIKILIEHLFM